MPDRSTEPPPRARHRARAFGLTIDASFPVPGLTPASTGGNGPTTTVDVVTEDEVDRDWVAGEAERVLEETFEEGEPPARTIDVHPRLGYRLYARHFGLARISPDGRAVVCAPPGEPGWDWQRFLVGRILPWASVLSGFEVLHASAVAIGGRAVLFVGDTGMGKTSLALRLAAEGAEFMADDVVALEAREAGVVGHAGAGIACVRPAERAAIPDATWTALGEELGHSGKTYLALSVAAEPRPLGALYFLRGRGERAIEPLAAIDPRLLLASTFVLGVQTPERLVNQLDVCARVSREVPVFALSVTRERDAGALAAEVTEHLTGLGVAA